MLLPSLLILPFLGSVVAALLPANARNREAWMAFALALAALALAAAQFPRVVAEEVLYFRAAWLPAHGADFVLRMDGLAWLFCMLVLVIGLLVILYARYYLSPRDPVPRFYAFLLAFMGSMLGVVLSGNLIQLVMFWEMTSLTSFLLIGYWHHRADARRGARMAFTVTAVGGLCLFGGVMLLGRIAGGYDLDTVLAAGDQVREHPWYGAVLALVLLGALSKSAQFPFHFWLPHAMAAPTPVSAYLHSATMVKAGIFLMIRLWPVLAGTGAWHWTVGLAGAATMLIGSWNAIFQHDLKGLLAYSTIAHLGLITLLLGIGSPLAVVAAIFHTANHATFKASLFMAVGIVDHETGSRDMRVLRGLRKPMPYTASLALVSSAAMAGVPLLNGFLSKEMFFSEALEAGDWWLPLAALLMGTFSVAYSLRFCSIFFGPLASGLPRAPHEPPRWMRFPAEFLALTCLVVGIVPGFSIGLLLHQAVFSVLGESTPAYSLAVWHGLNVPLLMSVLAMSAGVTFYIVLRRRFSLRQRTDSPLLARLSGRLAYENLMLALALGASRLERLLGTARLQPQLGLLAAAFIAVPLLALGTRGGALPLPAVPAGADDILFGILWLVGAACALAAAWQAKYHRLTALCLVSGTGIVVCLTFLWLSAPDLALTQLMVETVTTILILLGLRWLPPRIPPAGAPLRTALPARLRRARDLAAAIAAGVLMAVLSHAMLSREREGRLGDYFLENAYAGGGGTNAVNVLLVDFRGFDTFGEITVLCIVALSVYALLRRFRPAPESIALPPQQTHPADPAACQPSAAQADRGGYLMVPGIYLRLLLPVFLLVAAFFFMRGHNQPGGGFVAGLVFAVAVILQYMLGGTIWVEARLRSRPYAWLSVGLILAAFTGLGAALFGHPFLTSHTAHLDLPVLGELHVPSAFVFDLGVFCVVVGSTLLILVALAHQSIRSHRQAPALAEEPRAAAFDRENH